MGIAAKVHRRYQSKQWYLLFHKNIKILFITCLYLESNGLNLNPRSRKIQYLRALFLNLMLFGHNFSWHLWQCFLRRVSFLLLLNYCSCMMEHCDVQIDDLLFYVRWPFIHCWLWVLRIWVNHEIYEPFTKHSEKSKSLNQFLKLFQLYRISHVRNVCPRLRDMKLFHKLEKSKFEASFRREQEPNSFPN